MKLIPVSAELEYQIYRNPRVTVEYEIVPDDCMGGGPVPFVAPGGTRYELPDVPLMAMPERVER